MSSFADPVQYINEPEPVDPDAITAGYSKSGWYFWDETWAFCHGPYDNEATARNELRQYAALL